MKNIMIIALAVFLITGCANKTEESAKSVPEGNSVTIWTDKTELFMEYPQILVGDSVSFAAHLSFMDNFKPVEEGKMNLEFKSGANLVSLDLNAPAQSGIFRPKTVFKTPGIYNLTITFNGRVKDTLQVNNVVVYSNINEIKAKEEPGKENPISFLKEQQWKIDFAAEPAKLRKLSNAVKSNGEIISKMNNDVIVSAPFNGIIMPEENQAIPVIGTTVCKDSKLAVLTPSAGSDNGANFAAKYTSAKSEVDLTKIEFERAKRLYEGNAASLKEMQRAEALYNKALAEFSTIEKYVKPNNGTDFNFAIRAPINGSVEAIYFIPGKEIKAGEPMFRIINSSLIWLKANVPMNEISKLNNPSRASFRIQGIDSTFYVNQRNGRLISIGKAMNEETRTVPVIFELANNTKQLRIGMYTEISIFSEKMSNVLAIPETALLEEEGKYSVYVHFEGESFVKRDVEIGSIDNGLVEIKKGLKENDRVVIKGAYQIKLASLSSQLPAHGHVH